MAEEEQEKPEAVVVNKGFLNKKNIIMLVIMVVILSVIAVAAVMIVAKKDKANADEEQNISKQLMRDPPGAVFSFDPMVVNIARTQGTRYLKVTVGVEYAPVLLDVELNARKIQFQDILNRIFSSRTIEQIADIKERDDIKRDIRDEFNSVLSTPDGKIKNVFFSDFVIQ